jgi:polyketide cyclase/dehydrase/lipid transport protein
MVRALAVGLAVLAVLPVAANAHGPSRQKVTETVEINAPPDKVWKVIGNFQDMSWHPAVAKVEGQGGNDANATRTLTLKSGGTIAEKLDGYDAAKMTYKYEITNVDAKVLPVNNY